MLRKKGKFLLYAAGAESALGKEQRPPNKLAKGVCLGCAAGSRFFRFYEQDLEVSLCFFFADDYLGDGAVGVVFYLFGGTSFDTPTAVAGGSDWSFNVTGWSGSPTTKLCKINL